MSYNPPFGTSFPFTTDVDAPFRDSRDLDGYGATTITSMTSLQTPQCGPAAVHNLAVPGAFPLASYTVTPAAAPASQPQPADPMFL